MGYNWAGIGNALGAGFTSAYANKVDQSNQLNALTKKVKYLTALPAEEQQLAFGLLGSGKLQDPLASILAAILSQREIKVRQLSSGKIGTIPEVEFDPKIYERVE